MGEEKRERPRVLSSSPKYLTCGIVGNRFPHNDNLKFVDLTTIDNLAGRATHDFDARRSYVVDRSGRPLRVYHPVEEVDPDASRPQRDAPAHGTPRLSISACAFCSARLNAFQPIRFINQTSFDACSRPTTSATADFAHERDIALTSALILPILAP
jgi:hypothetical protein